MAHLQLMALTVNYGRDFWTCPLGLIEMPGPSALAVILGVVAFPVNIGHVCSTH